jgi:hypothetical protein
MPAQLGEEARDERLALHGGQGMVEEQIERILVAKEEGEGHFLRCENEKRHSRSRLRQKWRTRLRLCLQLARLSSAH